MSQAFFSQSMFAVLVPAALYACWKDYRSHRVPNWLNAAVAATGLLAQVQLRGSAGFYAAFGGMAAGFVPLFLFYLMKGMGAGDVKYLSAMGAWLGPQWTLQALVVGGLVGGVMALALVARQRNWRLAAADTGLLLARACSPRTAFNGVGPVPGSAGASLVLPYAIPLSIGAIAVLVANYSGWWKAI